LSFLRNRNTPKSLPTHPLSAYSPRHANALLPVDEIDIDPNFFPPFKRIRSKGPRLYFFQSNFPVERGWTWVFPDRGIRGVLRDSTPFFALTVATSHTLPPVHKAFREIQEVGPFMKDS